MLLRLLTVCLVTSTSVHGYCWQWGRNPTFSGPPTVTQIRWDLVRVSFGSGLLRMRECADQVFVKYWPLDEPHKARSTPPVPRTVDSIEIVVKEDEALVYQAVARENKGLFGTDDNASPVAIFSTNKLGGRHWPTLENATSGTQSLKSPISFFIHDVIRLISKFL